MKKSSNSYSRKKNVKFENGNFNSISEEENTENLTRKIEIYKNQIEKKLENVIKVIEINFNPRKLIKFYLKHLYLA